VKTREKIIVCSILFVVGGVVNIFFSTALHQILSRQSSVLRLAPLSECLSSIAGSRQHFILFLCLQGFVVILSLMFFLTNLRPYQSDLLKVTPDIETPVPVGQHQHGSSRWLTDKEKNKAFESYILNPNHTALRYLIKHGADDLKNDDDKKEKAAAPPPEETCKDSGKSRESEQSELPAFSVKRGGVVLGMKKEDDTEQIYYVGDDTHTLTIGATRSGKTRSVVLQSICTIALAGESMIISDPKAELYHYSAPFLRRLGYEVMALDFKNPEKSQHYNLLQPIIDAAKAGNMERAEMLAWDMTNILVGKETGNSEKIWHNGEMSVIAATILCVVVDNIKRYDYQNLTNVYWFMAEMCKTIGGKMPLLEYVKKLPQSHPARALLSISDVAPTRTRGSFYTSALTTLRLFTSKSINAITNKSDFFLTDVGIKKQALFLILPDEKTTFYPIASLIVSQQYELLANMADKRGGRLERRVNYILEEFGNFTPITDMTTKLTVAAGRGIRFNLYLQSFEQLKEKYDEHVSNTIKSNCQTWIYLQADDKETLQEISEKLGSYTTSSYQLSASHAKYSTPSSSQSVSLIERKLLTPDEVRRVSRPYQIVTSRNHPAMMFSPDLSQWYFNKMMGMGDMEHNRKLREKRENARPVLSDISKDVMLWNIWVYYQKDVARMVAEQKKQALGPGSFMDGETDFD
jgi:type IV secretion system protein VirD4